MELNASTALAALDKHAIRETDLVAQFSQPRKTVYEIYRVLESHGLVVRDRQRPLTWRLTVAGSKWLERNMT